MQVVGSVGEEFPQTGQLDRGTSWGSETHEWTNTDHSGVTNPCKKTPPKQTRIKQKTLHRHSWVPPRSKRRVYIMTSSVDIFSAVKRKRGEVDSLFPVWETDRKTPQTVRTGQERRREWWWSRGRQLYSDSCWCWGGGHYNGDINCIACGFVLWSNTIFTIFF